MASGYSYNGVDLDDLCEPKHPNGGYAITSNPGSVVGMSNFKKNNEHIGLRYARPNVNDSWAKILELPFYGNDYPFQFVEKGYLPTQTKFAELTSAGTYYVDVSATSLTIGSTTYPASHFRNGTIPRYIGVMLCGAGGGAGGYGCDKGDKDGFNITQGGGGGGGGVLLLVIDIYNLSSVVIGSGGGGGPTGSSDSRPSTGSTGGTGGQTVLNFISGATAGCYGGSGGKGGKGNSGSNDSVWGDGGAGGTSWCNEAYAVYSQTHSPGGKGGVCGSSGGQGTGSGLYSFTNGAGIDTTVMFDTPNTGQAIDGGNSYRNSWAGGGGSIGSGATDSASASMGGGGASGKSQNGATGYCAFYY